MKRPSYIIKLEDHLKESLVGEILPPTAQMILGDFVVKTPVRISQVMEDLTGTFIGRRASGATVTFEPNGKDTFPDIQVTFSKEYSSYLEVKTMANSATSNLQIASFTKLLESFAEQNPIYFQTYWVVWRWRQVPSGTLIEDVSIKNMLELAAHDNTGALSVEMRSGTRPYVFARPQNNFTDEREFYVAVKKAVKKANFTKSEKAQHCKNIDAFSSAILL